MLQEIPNSHYWNTLTSMSEWAKMVAIANISKAHLLEHLIIGLDNTIKNNYTIVKQETVKSGCASDEIGLVPVFDACRGCPKCGCLDNAFEYVKTTNVIDRVCRRCHYSWVERALDSIGVVVDNGWANAKYNKPGSIINPILDCSGVVDGGRGKISTREG